MSDAIIKGEMTTEHTVWCGAREPAGYQCCTWLQLPEPTRKMMGDAARRHGWRKTRDRGWLCPAHAKVP